jgi:hypothetical protein
MHFSVVAPSREKREKGRTPCWFSVIKQRPGVTCRRRRRPPAREDVLNAEGWSSMSGARVRGNIFGANVITSLASHWSRRRFMYCSGYQQLRDAEHLAWAAWKRVAGKPCSHRSAEQLDELSTLGKVATAVSMRVGEHIEKCTNCSVSLSMHHNAGPAMHGPLAGR